MRAFGGFLLTVFLLAACSGSEPTSLSASDRAIASVAVTTVACGDVITTDLRLEHDLSCPGDALTVTGVGLQINLNGHTISGAGVGVGIRVSASQDVTIHGGTLRGFLQAMFVALGSNALVIKDNEFTQNGTAILLQASSNNVIKGNIARQNSLRAFMMRPNIFGVVSTNNEFVDNVLIDNPTGIFIISQPGNIFKGNTISGSTVAAIDLPTPGASGNLFKGNLLTTSAAGFRFAAGWTGNTILGNTLDANSCAFLGPTGGNTLQGNTLTGNATDFCP